MDVCAAVPSHASDQSAVLAGSAQSSPSKAQPAVCSFSLCFHYSSAHLTSSVGVNLTRMLHRCPGARSPAKGSTSKTQGLAFSSCCSFRRTLAGKCLSTWAQKSTCEAPVPVMMDPAFLQVSDTVLGTGRHGCRWQTRGTPDREQFEMNQPCPVPSKGFVSSSLSAQTLIGCKKENRGQGKPTDKLQHCPCFIES